MENLGFIFGSMGMSMGVVGFVFATVCMGKLAKLEVRVSELESGQSDA